MDFVRVSIVRSPKSVPPVRFLTFRAYSSQQWHQSAATGTPTRRNIHARSRSRRRAGFLHPTEPTLHRYPAWRIVPGERHQRIVTFAHLPIPRGGHGPDKPPQNRRGSARCPPRTTSCPAVFLPCGQASPLKPVWRNWEPISRATPCVRTAAMPQVKTRPPKSARIPIASEKKPKKGQFPAKSPYLAPFFG